MGGWWISRWRMLWLREVRHREMSGWCSREKARNEDQRPGMSRSVVVDRTGTAFLL